MPLNPQVQKLADSKFSSISKLVAFETFQKEKQERKQIEQERKMMELNVAQLYRQAKRATKQLNKTQAALIQKLNKKSLKEDENRLKQEFRRLKEEQLHQQRNNNSLSRYMNMLKREQAKNRLNQQNRQISMYIKEREKHDQTMRKIKELEESRMTFEKNLALGNNLKIGVELARSKNLFEKKCLSSAVRNDLLEIQNRKIEQERSVIEQLTEKKHELKELFSKAKQQSHKYRTILDVGKNKSFIEMYELVAAKEGYHPETKKKMKKQSRKKKYFSETKIISSYLGTQEH